MTQEAKDLQNEVVRELVALLPSKDEITLKAPTGSGKTYMMGDFMNRILKDSEDVIFIVSSLSKTGLALQNYESFRHFAHKQFVHLKPYLIRSEISGEERIHIDQGHNVYVLGRDLYRNKGRLKDGGVLREFLHAQKGYGGSGAYVEKKIYFIKDECHIETNNLDALKAEYFDKVINFSATPEGKKDSKKVDICLDETKAVSAGLIKYVEYDETSSLEQALQKFMQLQRSYMDSVGVNPCLIIQISNKHKAKRELEEIKGILGKLEFSKLKWMYIGDKEQDSNDELKLKKLPRKKWKDFARDNHSTIDVIIFKLVISEGWDIPRACMLYQMRDSHSKQLDEQVIGRVRRNPKLLEFAQLEKNVQELLSVAYVYGVKQKENSHVRVRLKGEYENGLLANEVREAFKIRTIRIDRISNQKQSEKFDIDQILSCAKGPVVSKSIFELYDEIGKQNQELLNLLYAHFKRVNDFFRIGANIKLLAQKFYAIYEDKNRIKVSDEVAVFPLESAFGKNEHEDTIYNWIWESEGEKFCFDSEAELKWFKFLWEKVRDRETSSGERLIKRVEHKGNRIYLLGKNFLAGSELKFEYFALDSIRVTYPDFILKDWAGRFHIFEVKSINHSASKSIDSDEYKEKIEALRKCYKSASELVEYHFYIPILDGDKWKIDYFHNGDEDSITQDRIYEKLS